ncbi:unnamed protein product [Orchesella dallaii]|uniref:Uncharacterized protein n=1 Tax=Orchesella dallaii TaxID=48710 RepID=A0ABP1RGS5_9HEXA
MKSRVFILILALIVTSNAQQNIFVVCDDGYEVVNAPLCIKLLCLIGSFSCFDDSVACCCDGKCTCCKSDCSNSHDPDVALYCPIPRSENGTYSTIRNEDIVNNSTHLVEKTK